MNTPILNCVNLTKSYKNGMPVLYNFNFSVESGKIVGLF